MHPNQSLDFHSSNPYATLIDNTKGGHFLNSGGTIRTYPNHGKYLLFWNFEYGRRQSKRYNFWETDKFRRPHAAFYKPGFVGLTTSSPSIKLNFHDPLKRIWMNESFGKKVYPKSLFNAQSKLRRCMKGK